MCAKKILIVDDEDTLCQALKLNLELSGYEAETALSAEAALLLKPGRFDLILLDIMMDGISGLQLARLLRLDPATANVPIIFCTAKDTDDDMVEGLRAGGDDYITKPYSISVMLARIEAVLRRAAKEGAQSGEPRRDAVATDVPAVISYQGLELHPASKRCTVDGHEVRMPRKEFEILQTLLANPGRVFTREELLARIWPEEVIVLPRVVDVNVTRIRQKIGQYAPLLITRPGYGYAFAAQ